MSSPELGTGGISGVQMWFAADKVTFGKPAVCPLRSSIASSMKWAVGVRLLPRGVPSAFPLLGCLPATIGQLCWLLVLLAKIPAGFSPQRPKPQACATPAEEAQTRVNLAPRTLWPLALGQA